MRRLHFSLSYIGQVCIIKRPSSLYYAYDLFHLNQYLVLLVIAFTNSLPLIFPNAAFTLGQLTITGEKSTVNDRYLPVDQL